MKPCRRNICEELGFHGHDHKSLQIRRMQREFVSLDPDTAAVVEHFTKPQTISWNDFPAKIKNQVLDNLFDELNRGPKITKPEKRAIRKLSQISCSFGQDDCLPCVRDTFRCMEVKAYWRYNLDMGKNEPWSRYMEYMIAFEKTAESLAK